MTRPARPAASYQTKSTPTTPQHAGMLSKYGIDPGNITDKLGGLGKLL